MMRRFALLLLTIFVFALAASQALATLSAQGTFTSSGGPTAYHYTLTIKNTGDTAISVFWFAWVPGEDFMGVSPTNVVAPTGWTFDFVSNQGASDGYGIHFTSAATLAPGATATGFTFDSTMTPDQMAGNSPFFPATPVGTSVVFNGAQTAESTFIVTKATTSLTLTGFSLQQSAIVGGNPASGTATISGPAGSSGVSISLSSNNTAAATVPASVTVADGATYAPVSVTTHGVDAAASVNITASAGGQSKIGALTVQPASLASISVPQAIQGGVSTSGSFTLNGQAGPSGKSGTLSSDSASLKVGASATVASGTTSVKFGISTVAVDADTLVHVSTTVNGTTKSGTTTVLAAQLKNIVVSSHIYGGMKGSLLIYLTGKAGPSGTTVGLSSNNSSAASVASTGTVAAGHGSGSAIITTSPVTSSTSVTLTATRDTVTKQVSTAILPAVLNAVVAASTTLTGGTTTKGTVALLGSTASGYSVSLTSSDTTAITVPSGVTVPVGKSAISFTITSHAVASAKQVTITAKHGALVRTVIITVNP